MCKMRRQKTFPMTQNDPDRHDPLFPGQKAAKYFYAAEQFEFSFTPGPGNPGPQPPSPAAFGAVLVGSTTSDECAIDIRKWPRTRRNGHEARKSSTPPTAEDFDEW